MSAQSLSWNKTNKYSVDKLSISFDSYIQDVFLLIDSIQGRLPITSMRHSSVFLVALTLLASLLPASHLRAEPPGQWNLLTDEGPFCRNSAVVFHDKIVAIGCERLGYYDSEYTQSDKIASSPDGISWQTINRPWSDGSGDVKLVVFKDQLWALIGRDEGQLEIWRSADAVTWSQVISASAPPGRHEFGVAVFHDKLWVVGGYIEYSNSTAPGGPLDDVWSSSDGTSWTLVAQGNKIPWYTRGGHACVVFNDRLWVIGGMADTSEDCSDGYQIFSDVWSTADGVTWIKESVLDVPRGKLTATVFNDKLWVIGGEQYYHYWDDYDTYSLWGETADSILTSTDGKSWTTLSTMSMGPRQSHSTVVLKDRMILIGGYYWSEYYTSYGYEDDYLSGDNDVWATPDRRYGAEAVTNPLTWHLPRQAGQQIQLHIKNTGLIPWHADEGYCLKCFGDPDEIWTAPSAMIPLAAGTVVNPGETVTFTIPVDMSKLWNPTTLTVQMFKEQVGHFGDLFKISVDFIPKQRILWHRIENPTGLEQSNFPLATASDDHLWFRNWRSANGREWIKCSEVANTPWATQSEADIDPYQDQNGDKFLWFNNKFWVIRDRSIWKSSDGMTWSHAVDKVPWPSVVRDELDGNPYQPHVSSACVCNGKLFVMIFYDLYDGYGRLVYNCLWSTSDGVNWRKAGEFQDLLGPGAMVSFKDSLWIFGGYSYDYDWDDDSFDFYDVDTIYQSTDGGSNWSEVGHLPESVRNLNVVVYQNKLWAINPPSAQRNNVWVSENGINWEPTNRFPMVGVNFRTDFYSSFVYDDKIWVLVGRKDYYNNDGLLSIWWGQTDSHSVLATPARLDFGRRVNFSGPSAPLSVTLTSTGVDSLTFTGKGVEIVNSRPGEFILMNPLNTATMSAQTTRTVQVAFNPMHLGAATATLRITTNDVKHPTMDIPLLGYGLSPLPTSAANILPYLLGQTTDPTGLDQNGDSRIDVADLTCARNGQILVNMPKRGDRLVMGSTVTIRWSVNSKISRVNLTLVSDHGSPRTVVSNASNDGQYHWTVQSDVIPDDIYTIIVSDAAHSATQGESAGFFSICSRDGVLAVTYPKGGERLKRNEKTPINWSLTVPPGTSGVSKVRIELYKGRKYYKTIASSCSTAAGSVYGWAIPSDLPVGDDYQIVISDADRATRRDASDAVFSIQ